MAVLLTIVPAMVVFRLHGGDSCAFFAAGGKEQGNQNQIKQWSSHAAEAIKLTFFAFKTVPG
jgi:hypothetical protein